MITPSTPSEAQTLLAEHLRLLPAGATCKGLFFRGTLERARVVAPRLVAHAAAGIEERRYIPFFDYPYADYLRLNLACARAMFPAVSTAEGLRRLGATAYDSLLESQVGRVLFGAFAGDFERVVMMGGRGYAVSLNFGKVDVERVATRHVRYRFHDTPAFLETFQVGVVDGGMRACGVTGEVRVTAKDLANALFDITWQPR
jgi:uncharacterized protein (TIGR02265 family)